MRRTLMASDVSVWPFFVEGSRLGGINDLGLVGHALLSCMESPRQIVSA